MFDAYPDGVRDRLLDLRELIFTVACDNDRVGELVETLKWGQPSYLNARPRVGTTIRIDAIRAKPDRYAMYFHCQTQLIFNFREKFADELCFEGNRAIVFDQEAAVPESALRECVAMALTYHLDK